MNGNTVAKHALTPADAQALTEDIRNHVNSAWSLLSRAHIGQAWRALGYNTWAEYVREEFNMSRSRSYQILDQARVISELEAVVSTSVDISEADARALKPHLSVLIADIREQVEDVDADDEARITSIVKNAIVSHKPVVSITTRQSESVTESFDAATGEVIEAGKADPVQLAATDFPDLQYYIDKGDPGHAVRLAAALRTYVEPELTMRLNNLRLSIDADKRRNVNLPPVPAVEKTVKQQNAEQAARDFGTAIYALTRTTTPEGRDVILRAWALGAEECTPTTREHVTPGWFRTIARGLNALANEWESK